MKELLERYADIITQSEILLWESQPTSYRFEAKVTCIDGSSLLVKDYMFFSTGRKYAYHWQTAEGILKIRWDNAPHWKEVETFPHHKHVGEQALPSHEMTLEDVLGWIHQHIGVQKDHCEAP